jgi:hypothetical protein
MRWMLSLLLFLMMLIAHMRQCSGISLHSIAGEAASVHIMCGKNSDSGVDISLVHDAAAGAPVGASIRRDVLFNVLAECRVTKSAGELDLMSYASWISSMAHVDVMREVHPGMLEYQLEARFLFHIAYHGNTAFVTPAIPLPHLPTRRLPPLCLHLHLRLRSKQRHFALRPCGCCPPVVSPPPCSALMRSQVRPTSACFRPTTSRCWTWVPSALRAPACLAASRCLMRSQVLLLLQRHHVLLSRLPHFFSRPALRVRNRP